MEDIEVIKSEKREKCPACGSSGDYLYQNLNDRLFGKSKGWNFRKCANSDCGLFWLDPVPMKDEIWKAYSSYYTHSEQKSSFFYNENLARAYLSLRYEYFPEYGLFKKLMGWIVYLNPLLRAEVDFGIFYLHNNPNGKVLDYGCGNGWLLDQLKLLGWETYGVDFDEKAVEYCNSKGLNVTRPDMTVFPDSYFDVITINHVIEHVHEFTDLIQQCYKKLKQGGKMVIATPNTDNWLLKKYKSNWMQLDPPRHLQLFNLKNLEDLLLKSGFKTKKMTSSLRIDAWATIVSRIIRRKGYFKYGENKKGKLDVVIGLLHQVITSFLLLFNKKVGGEIIVEAEKSRL